MSDRGAAAHRRARSVEELVRFRFPAVGPSALTGAEDVGSTGIFPAAAATEGAKIGAAMPLHNPLLHQDLLDQGMSAAAQRAGQVLAKLSEVELLAVLGVELQRRGLQQLGELPKPRAKVVKRRTPEREQMLLLLPVHDGMSNL